MGNQNISYGENKKLVKKLYENALHHDDVSSLKKINIKFNTDPLDYLDIDKVVDYNAPEILNYLIQNGMNIYYEYSHFLKNVIQKGKFKIAKALYDNNYFTKYIKELTYMDISQKKIHSLDGIELFSNLEVLDCGMNNIQSLELLKYSIHLIKLICDHNKIYSIKPIEHLLPQLQVLYINHNPLDRESINLLNKYNHKDISFMY